EPLAAARPRARAQSTAGAGVRSSRARRRRRVRRAQELRARAARTPGRRGLILRWSRRKILTGAIVGVPALLVARPAAHLVRAAWRDREEELPAVPSGRVDDASRLEETAVAEIASPADEAELAAVLRRAAEAGLAVS